MTYRDVVKNGWILPKKCKYTIHDFRRLTAAGFSQIDARFILICSAIYHYDADAAGWAAHITARIPSRRFLMECELGIAH